MVGVSMGCRRGVSKPKRRHHRPLADSWAYSESLCTPTFGIAGALVLQAISYHWWIVLLQISTPRFCFRWLRSGCSGLVWPTPSPLPCHPLPRCCVVGSSFLCHPNFLESAAVFLAATDPQHTCSSHILSRPPCCHFADVVVADLRVRAFWIANEEISLFDESVDFPSKTRTLSTSAVRLGCDTPGFDCFAYKPKVKLSFWVPVFEAVKHDSWINLITNCIRKPHYEYQFLRYLAHRDLLMLFIHYKQNSNSEYWLLSRRDDSAGPIRL